MANASIQTIDIYSKPPFNTFGYSKVVQVYYIISGILTIIGNFYLIFLFILFQKLRQVQCNWLIAYLSAVEVLIGIGTVIRGSLIIIAFDYNILEFNFIFCSISIPIIFSVSYRLEQTIALMIAIDRLVAIWRPIWYNNHQDYRICSIAAIIIVLVFAFLTFLVFFDVEEKNLYDLKDVRLLTLDKCVIPITFYWYHVLPSYSGTISIVFFVIYLIGLIMFWRTLNKTKKSQVHATSSLARMQSKMFVTVSLALFSMSIFYVTPTILQMLAYYFQLGNSVSTIFTNVALLFIQYGAEFNGILNALIYSLKHQEFRESSKKLFNRFTGKVATLGNNNTSNNVFVHKITKNTPVP